MSELRLPFSLGCGLLEYVRDDVIFNYTLT